MCLESSARRCVPLLLVAFSAFLAACRDGERAPGGRAGGHGVETATFAGLDDFVARTAPSGTASGPIVFIGIDGASWEFIDSLIARGELPNLRRLKEAGAYGRLRSIPCYVSPPAWTTMLTGYEPAHTGVYTFGEWDGTRRQFDIVNATDVRVPSVWDVASYCGSKVGVFNVPMTYPAHPVDGVMVTGLMTPSEVGAPPQSRPSRQPVRNVVPQRHPVHSYSPVLRTVVGDSLNTYLWSLYDTVDDGVRDYDAVVLSTHTDVDPVSGGPRVGFYTFDVGRFSPWIRIRARRNGSIEDGWCKAAIVHTGEGRYETRLSPTFFRIDGAYTYPDTLAAVLNEEFGCYIPSPFAGAELVPSFTRDAVAQASYLYRLDDWDLYFYVFTQSDNIHHLTGFSPAAAQVYRTIDGFVGEILDAMPENGTLIVASDHGFRPYAKGIDLNQIFAQLGLLVWDDEGGIDYDHTLVFHHIWHLYFNHDLVDRRELSRRGIEVPPRTDPEAYFAEYVARALESIASVRAVPVPVADGYRSGEDAERDDPDMFVSSLRDDYVIDFLGLSNARRAGIHDVHGAERWWHARDGVFMVKGPGVRRGFDAGTRDIQDIAPTILYLAGLPLAADMDGRVMFDVFTSGRLAGRRLNITDDYAAIENVRDSDDMARESLAKKLRSLGYIR